jgi:hypothetical protein
LAAKWRVVKDVRNRKEEFVASKAQGMDLFCMVPSFVFE